MAKRKIIWTKNSIKERTKIYDYWNNRNKSKEFSKKLHRLFIKSLQPLKTNPELGVLNNELDFRYLIKSKIYFKALSCQDFDVLPKLLEQ